MNILRRIFTWQGMLKSHQIKGEMPSNKELYKSTFAVAWPSALENLLISLISAIDMMMVGFLGKEAIAAVGIVTQPKFICLAPIFAINTAVIVFVARRKGAKLQSEANDFMKIGLLITTIVTLTICTLSYIFAEPLLAFAGARADYIDTAVEYFHILLISLVPYSIGLTMTAAQRGAGYTKISMVTNLTANIVNIIFNFLLIHGLCGFPALGVKGAAIATAIGNFVSFFIALYSITRKNGYLHLNFTKIHDFLLKLENLVSIMSNALIEQMFLRIGFFSFSKVVANLGTAEFAAHQVCMNVMQISFALGDGLQVANTSLVGQSLGAKRKDLAIVRTRISQVMGLFIAFIICFIIIYFNSEIVYLFSQETSVIELATIPMIMLGITVLFQIPQVIIVGSLRGAGDVKFVAWMMLLCVGLIRPIAGYIFAYPFGLGLIGAWIGLFMDQITRFIISFIRFKTGKWLEFKV